MENNQTQATPVYKKKSAAFSFFVIGLLVLISFSLGLMIGLWTNSGTALSFSKLLSSLPDSFAQTGVRTQTFTDVWESIQNRYVGGSQEPEKMYYGALSGLVQSLGDPYSVFLDPEMTKEFSRELEGEFDGIGAEIGFKDNILTIVSPLRDSPASKAGLRAGDHVLHIDGKDTSNLSLSEAVALIRGEKGTTVRLELFRSEEDAPFTVDVTRDTITVESVQWRMIGSIAYIEIIHFDSQSGTKFDQVLREALVQNPTGVVVDLRDNPGGYLEDAVHIASAFLPESGQAVVIERFRDGKEEIHSTERAGTLVDLPVVVLANEGSASASEIVAGALQDHGRAKIVGKKTFGKGTVQDLEEFSDGSSLKLTIAEWLTPKKRSINKDGISPDIEVDRTIDDTEDDAQLQKALEIVTLP